MIKTFVSEVKKAINASFDNGDGKSEIENNSLRIGSSGVKDTQLTQNHSSGTPIFSILLKMRV